METITTKELTQEEKIMLDNLLNMEFIEEEDYDFQRNTFGDILEDMKKFKIELSNELENLLNRVYDTKLKGIC